MKCRALTAADCMVGRNRQKTSEMSEFCLLLPPNPARAAPKVDKNRGKCPNFVYRRLRSRQKTSEMPEFCLLLPPNPARAPPKVDKNEAKCPNFVYTATPQNPSTQSVGILASPRIPPIQIIKDKILGRPRIFFQ